MLVVDSNVLVYAAHRGAAERPRCAALLERLRGERTPWHTTWSVIYEFLRVATHRRILTQPWTMAAAWGFIEAMRASPGFSILVATDRHAALVAQAVGELPDLRGNIAHDLHTAVLMREHGIRTIYTRDTDFHRFPWVEVIDPLA